MMQFMTWERQRAYDYDDGKEAGIAIGLEQGREEGIEIGAQQKAIEAARNLLNMKVLTPEQIAQSVDLPLEQVLELAEKIARLDT